ncbi:MAG: phosphoenolpyruvate synthase [Thiotrichales bacterium]
MNQYIIGLDELGMHDVPIVGGKNASLGEMIRNLSDAGVAVPSGFATTAHAFVEFLESRGISAKIYAALAKLNVDDVNALAVTGEQIRQWVLETPFQPALDEAIEAAYAKLEVEYGADVSWAVRSSATAEDLPEASFAGQQETYLNVRGLEHIKLAVHRVFASLFNDRAISYRVHQGFDHKQVALSAGVQKMIRSDLATSGVMFTLDTESGFDQVVFITASYGLGEMVVQGAVNPDEFYVFKPALARGHKAVLRRNVGGKAIRMVFDGDPKHPVRTESVPEPDRHLFCVSDADVEELARMAVAIEKHYGRPMDIEWAKDGVDGRLYIVQARPETVQSRRGNVIERFTLKAHGPRLASGRAIGSRIGRGKAVVINNLRQMDRIKPGDVLVTDMTDPDWEPIMKRASAIVTNRGGRTCHAAIIARELGVPAVVGCNDATANIPDGHEVTVSCAEGDTGIVYEGLLDFEHKEISLDAMPEIPVKLMMNVANADRAFSFGRIPSAGVGLARMEFIINHMIGVHPRALLEPEKTSADVRALVNERVAAYGDPKSFYISKIVEGVACIAASFYPKPVIVRMSDFKSNEYANLIGGKAFEPHEENPMIGFRGASRYVSESFRSSFDLECAALKRVRDELGFTNVEVMIPFVRTVDEGREVVEILAANGLKRGENGLRVIMMCELPSNAVLADQFLEHFDGFSIGSNDMTQLTLGLDRDSAAIAHVFDERNPAVLAMLEMAIAACHKADKYVGICGQGPSDHPDLAKWLLDRKITSISLNPDTVLDTWLYLAGQAQG